MKSVILIVLLAIPVCSFGSIGILLEGSGFKWTSYDYSIANRYDVEKDGIDEFVYLSAWNVLRAINGSGTEVWSYTMVPAEVCPSCSTDPQYWSMELHGFVDTEPAQRDALVVFRYQDFGSNEFWIGLGLVSASTGVLRQTFPGRYFVACLDLGGDGLWELALSQTEGPPEGYWEIWGYGSITGVPDAAVPGSNIALRQNHPNPFNPTTKIDFTMQQAGPVRIEFFDSAGRLVDGVDLGHLPPGPHQYTWPGRGSDGRFLPSGAYFFSVVSGSDRQSRKMLLLK